MFKRKKRRRKEEMIREIEEKLVGVKKKYWEHMMSEKTDRQEDRATSNHKQLSKSAILLSSKPITATGAKVFAALVSRRPQALGVDAPRPGSACRERQVGVKWPRPQFGTWRVAGQYHNEDGPVTTP